MPIFEFACRRCGHQFERLLGTATARVSCPSCRSPRVVKRFSLFGSRSSGKFTSSQGGGCSSCAKSSCSSCK